MKTIISASILCCVAVLCASAQPLQTGTTASAAPVSSAAAIAAMPVTADGYSLTEVGPDSRRWSRVTALAGAHGELRYVTNSYVELQDCMYYIRQGPTGPEWAESKAEIEGFPGGAVARQGWIQMIFANDLATPGAIDAQTPAGRFRSHVLGLCYADSSLQTNIWIAEVKSCQGQIISSNQVLYPDALVGDGFAAGVRYTLGISGWEQDVLINDPAAMMAPETYGLDSSSPTLTLQAITEFVDSAVPTQTSRTVTTAEGAVFQDEDIDWGSLKLEHGKAFFLGQNPDAKGIPVNKRWVEVNSRHLLVEEMPFSSLMKALLSKGQGGSLKPGAKSNRQLASLKGLPVLPPAKRDPKPMQVAAAPPGQTGFLLDYQATLNSTRNNFVFAADTTYYVPGTSGAVNLNGTTTLEAGTVIKFASTNTANLLVNGPLICQSGPYRMAYLTSKHDTSVGETISGASGNPTNTGTIYFDAAASQTNAYSYLRVAYAATALRGPNFSNGVSHCQFVQCGTAVNSTSNQPVALRNVLLAQCTNAVVTTGTFTGEHLTVDQCSTLLSGAGSSGNLTNCLLTAVSTLGNVTRYASPNLAASNGVFQSVGAANYYLVNGSTNRQAGLTNINAALAANLRKLTTYPPAVLTNDFTVSTTLSPQALRDYSAGDLGYHYCPLDYLWTSLNLTNATLTLTNGVAVGFYGRNALYLRAGAQLVSEGGPVNLNRLVRSGLVQEQPVLAGASAVAHLEIGGSYSPRPVIQLRFTDLPAAGGSGLAASYYLSGGYYPIERVTLRDCWLRGGKLSLLPAGGSAVTLGVTNNLVERGIIEFKHASGAENTPLSLYLFNNLFWAGTLTLQYDSGTSNPYWNVYDNVLDNVTLQESGTAADIYIHNGNNGYVNTSTLIYGISNVTVSTFTYTNSWLGRFYQVSTSFLNKGSRAADVAGLYHYTVLASQIRETNSVVDIGCHAVAVDANGNPVDTDGDGLADVQEDANGNGALNSGETDWTNPDTDYDGRSDGQEVADGTNPLDPNSFQSARLGYWRFDDTSTWAGEQGQAPLSVTNISATSSWSTNAALMHNTNGAALRYRDVEANGAANIACRRGTVRFWFRPDWSSTDAGGTGPGGLGRFLELGTRTSSNSWWGLLVSADGTQLVFGTQTNALAQTNLTAAISWSCDQWYQLVLAYTPTNSALYINGALATNGAGVAYYPKLAERASSGLRIGSDQNGSNQAAGAFDELETFNYPLDATSIQTNYQAIITADSDADNLPDFWERCWFGNLDHTDTELDAYGYTLLSDYENSRDPNVILFTAGVTNSYLNTNSATVELAVTAGAPAYVALLVNDTNAANANWQAFSSTNLSVSTPTDGVYVVTVGLRGPAPNASQSWQTLTLFRDSTPLTLALTNVAGFSGSRPFIDPAGYAGRALSSLTCTVVDANGTTNTGSAIVVAQGWNLSDRFHTSNWFQCVDLALALGTNLISIQAEDWAGNVAVTNFAYVFNTNGDSTPPSLTLVWPQNGTLVSGDTLTIQASTDDDTAAVALQYTDTDATVQTVNGLIERGGNVWVADVPLTAGTNSLSLTTTDAAGNVNTTNFMVVQTNVVLIVYPLSQDAMQYGYATVAVTAEDPGCTNVVVNGVEGVPWGGGYWEVENVPLQPGGTIVLQATAQLANGATTETRLKQERDPVVFTQTFGFKLDYSLFDWTGDATNGFETHHKELQWARGVGGTNLETWWALDFDTGYVSSNLTVTIWPADNGYLPMLKGQQVINEYEEGQLTASSTNTLDAPAVEWMETSTSVGTWPENFGVSWTESSAREVRLFTGGDATRGRQGLFDLSASLSRESEVNSDVPNWKFLYHGFSPFLQPASPAIIVPPQYINVGTLGKLGNDGHRWKVLPDGKESIATPQAPLTSYTGQLPLPQKYKPYIELTTATTNANLGHDTPKICVGQQVTFTLSGLPSYEAQVGRWNLPQKYVNESWQLQEYVVTIPPDGYWVSYGSVNYRINSDLLTNLTTQCWYVSNLGSTVTAAWNLQFPNGQQVIVLARGSFTVFTPTVGMVSSALHGTPTVIWTRPWSQVWPLEFGAFALGITGTTNNMAYRLRFTSSDFAGAGKITQLCNIDASGLDTGCTGCLDGVDPYSSTSVMKNANPTGNMNLLDLEDAPNANTTTGTIYMQDSFDDYVMFSPDPQSSSIYVTIAKTTWSVNASVVYPSTTISQTVTGPTGLTNCTDFPVWTTTRQE